MTTEAEAIAFLIKTGQIKDVPKSTAQTKKEEE
jgi:hypothetical protein